MGGLTKPGVEVVRRQLALVDCSQEGTGDSGWDVPLCPSITIESVVTGVFPRSVIHAGTCLEPSLLLAHYPEGYVLES